jgi:hypothetical protein
MLNIVSSALSRILQGSLQTRAGAPGEKRGPVLDVLSELLTERRDGEVLAFVSKLMMRNSELERRPMQILSRTTRTRACRRRS